MNTNTKTSKETIEEAERIFSTVPADKRDIIMGVLIGMELAEEKAAKEVQESA